MLRRLIFLVVVFGWALAHRASADLVGFWEFEDADGGVIKDSSGNGYNGMIVGGAEVVADPVRGQVLRNVAGGSVDLFNVPNPVPGFAANSSITLAVWVKPEAAPSTNWDYVIQLGRNGDNPIVSLGVTTDGRIASYAETDQPGGNLDQVSVFSGAVEGGIEIWHHIAVVYDRATDTATTYIDGVADATTDISLLQDDYAFTWTSAFLGTDQGDGRFYIGLMDDVAVFDHALTEAEIQKIMQGLNLEFATQPQPEGAAVDVLRDARLSWKPGIFAVTHDLYVGESFEAVDTATVPTVSGLDVNSFDAGRMDFGKTVFWRVDEVNGTPDNTVFKGDVWSFEVEPYSIQIAGSDIMVTASSSSNESSLPEKTVDGSGLGEDGTHAIQNETMWFAAMGDMDPWIQYEFDGIKKLDTMKVWNSNSSAEGFIGYGVNSVLIETSKDGETWNLFEDVNEFSRAPGLPTYDQYDEIALGGLAAKMVRLTIQSNFGGFMQSYSLSEVQFAQIPVAARTPDPESDSVDVLPNAVVSWRAGREAAQSTIYVSTDPNEVADGIAASATSNTNSIDLSSFDLQMGQTYYWRVDEVNEAEVESVWAGPVWSFSTVAAIVVDDFESYGNDSPDRPFQTWLDGAGYSADEFFSVAYGGNGTGAAVGHDIWDGASPHYNGDIMETANAMPGSGQSMPFYYGNTGGVASQTERSLSPAQDWTIGGAKTLSIAFAGQTGNTGTLYVKINNTKLTYPHAATNIAIGAWQAWNIDLTSMNVQNVTTLQIGVDGNGASGMILIDDIRLHAEAGQVITPVDPGTNGLIAKFTFNGDTSDSSGNGHNGIVVGTDGTGIVNDPVRGQVLSLPGGDDQYVEVGVVGISGTMPRTIACWAKAANTEIPDWSLIFGFTGQADSTGGNGSHFNIGSLGGPGGVGAHVWGWEETMVSDDDALEWHHYTMTYDGTTIAYFADGIEMDSDGAKSNVQDLTPSADRVHIGSRITSTLSFVGNVDDAVIYDRVLSAGEILSLAEITAPIDKPF